MQVDRGSVGGGSGVRPDDRAPSGAPTRIGVLPLIEAAQLRAAWEGDRLKPWLRQVILTADFLCREHGGRLRVTKLLGEGIYASGAAADVLALGMPVTRPGVNQRIDPDSHPRWLCFRLNELYVYGDGSIETALYLEQEGRIRLRVPPLGYRPDSRSLSTWQEWGVTPGEVKPPRRVLV